MTTWDWCIHFSESAACESSACSDSGKHSIRIEEQRQLTSHFCLYKIIDIYKWHITSHNIEIKRGLDVSMYFSE